MALPKVGFYFFCYIDSMIVQFFLWGWHLWPSSVAFCVESQRHMCYHPMAVKPFERPERVERKLNCTRTGSAVFRECYSWVECVRPLKVRWLLAGPSSTSAKGSNNLHVGQHPLMLRGIVVELRRGQVMAWLYCRETAVQVAVIHGCDDMVEGKLLVQKFVGGATGGEYGSGNYLDLCRKLSASSSSRHFGLMYKRLTRTSSVPIM